MPAPTKDLTPLATATEGLPTPYAVIDLDAFDANAADMTERAHGLPIRIASKSLRCRALLDRALAGPAPAAEPDGSLPIPTVRPGPGFRGVLAYALREAIWLVRGGHTDVVVGYPTVDLDALTDLSQHPELAAAITLMVDSRAHLDLIDRAAPRQPVRVAIDVDASLRLGPVHLGVRRSPIHSPADAKGLAQQIARRESARLVGMMVYDAQIAGLPDASAAVRAVKQASEAELARRRAAVVAAVQPYAQLEFVNGGGTGSLHLTSVDGQLTELAGGSGLYGPTLFDGYRAFTPQPAMYFATAVVRRPSARHATVFSGGYVASGGPGWSRVPTPVWPPGLSLLRSEGAGEVQTPLGGTRAGRLQIGDRVWFRHAKAGEACERFDRVHLVRGDQLVDTVPTYRGEGQNFG